jgi:DNA-binding NarL/FixJ family response regulator
MLMSRIRILIADHQPLMRQAIRQSLEVEEDFEVLGEAEDGETAVGLACRLDPDVVLVEVEMPRLDGLEATMRIKRARPAMSVLVLTAHDEEEHVVSLLDAGADGYLLKTASSQMLVQAVRSVRHGGTVLDPAVCERLLRRKADRHQPEPHDSKRASDRLTARETEVLCLAATGMRNEVIASRMGIAVRTVKGHMVDIFAKMRVESRTEAVFQALKLGYINIDDLG